MYTDVVVGIDGTDAGRDALAMGQTLAPRATRFALAHVRELGVAVPRDHNAILRARTREDSIRLLSAERASVAGVEILSVLAPDVGSGLHDVAESRGADLLVIGSGRRAAIGEVLVGDDARAVLDRAPCTVAVAPRGYRTRVQAVKVIGVAYDDAAQSNMALACARRLAGETGARVVARHVLALNRHRVGETLAAFSETVDLLICGSRSTGIVRRVALGSASDYLSRHCACPLIITTAALKEPISPADAPDRLATA